MALDSAPANAPYKLDLVQPKGLQDLFQPVPNSSLGYSMPTAPGLVAGGVDLGSGYTVGLIQALQIIVQNLSAITANIGTLVINKGGSLSSGETAYQTGVGFWLGTDASGNPQFSIVDANGNYIKFDGSSANPISISSSGVINVLSSKQVDDGAWKTLAAFNFITGLPTTRAGYGITDAQGTLPNASAVGQVLQRDNGGSPYFAAKYDGQMNAGVITNSGTQAFTANADVLFGTILDMGRPPNGVSAFFDMKFFLSGAATPNASIKLQYSTDGGATWTVIDSDVYTTTVVGADVVFRGFVNNLTLTGNLQVKTTIANSSGVNTVSARDLVLWCQVVPNANFTSVTGPLAASVPATGAGNCNAVYPATTCTASSNVTVTPSGGSPAYTYSWAVVSGTGTITSGSTAQTCTVSDTETATTGGATFNTTVHCTVTDTFPHNVTSGNCVITNTFTQVFNPISGSVANADGSCSKFSCPGTCTASGKLTANATGGNGSYTYSWSVTSGSGTITAGSTSQTCTISQTNATTPGGTVQSTTGRCAVNDTRGTGSVNMSGTLNLIFTCNS